MKVIVTATVEVSFEAYPTESENKKAQQHIHQWIKDLLEGGTARFEKKRKKIARPLFLTQMKFQCSRFPVKSTSRHWEIFQ